MHATGSEDRTPCRTHVFSQCRALDHRSSLALACGSSLGLCCTFAHLKSHPHSTCFIDHSLMCLTHFLFFVPHRLRLHRLHCLCLESGDRRAPLRTEDFSLAAWSNLHCSQVMSPRPASTSAVSSRRSTTNRGETASTPATTTSQPQSQPPKVEVDFTTVLSGAREVSSNPLCVSGFQQQAVAGGSQQHASSSVIIHG